LAIERAAISRLGLGRAVVVVVPAGKAEEVFGLEVGEWGLRIRRFACGLEIRDWRLDASRGRIAGDAS